MRGGETMERIKAFLRVMAAAMIDAHRDSFCA